MPEHDQETAVDESAPSVDAEAETTSADSGDSREGGRWGWRRGPRSDSAAGSEPSLADVAARLGTEPSRGSTAFPWLGSPDAAAETHTDDAAASLAEVAQSFEHREPVPAADSFQPAEPVPAADASMAETSVSDAAADPEWVEPEREWGAPRPPATQLPEPVFMDAPELDLDPVASPTDEIESPAADGSSVEADAEPWVVDSDVAAEPDPEPVVVDAVPEPGPEPVVVDAVPEPDPEPVIVEEDVVDAEVIDAEVIADSEPGEDSADADAESSTPDESGLDSVAQAPRSPTIDVASEPVAADAAAAAPEPPVSPVDADLVAPVAAARDQAASSIARTEKVRSLEIEVARLNAELAEARGEDATTGASRFLTIAVSTIETAIADVRAEAEAATGRVDEAAQARIGEMQAQLDTARQQLDEQRDAARREASEASREVDTARVEAARLAAEAEQAARALEAEAKINAEKRQAEAAERAAALEAEATQRAEQARREAEEAANAMRNEFEAEAETLWKNVELHAQSVRAETESTAQEMRRKAEEDAERIKAEAEALAAQKQATIEAQAAARRAQIDEEVEAARREATEKAERTAELARADAEQLIDKARAEAARADGQERARIERETIALAGVRESLVRERQALEEYHGTLRLRVHELAEAMVSFMRTGPDDHAMSQLADIQLPEIGPPPASRWVEEQTGVAAVRPAGTEPTLAPGTPATDSQSPPDDDDSSADASHESLFETWQRASPSAGPASTRPVFDASPAAGDGGADLFAPANDDEGEPAETTLSELFARGGDRLVQQSKPEDLRAALDDTSSSAEAQFQEFIAGDDDDSSRRWLLRSDES